MNVTLRKATAMDSERVLTWRNEASTIPWMGAPRALTYDEHEAWFMKTISSPENLFYIIEADANPVGQIRYVLSEANLAKVSINITEAMHGKGIASIAFREGSACVRACGFADSIYAYVLPDNIGSIRAMEKAGYVRKELLDVRGVTHLRMLDLGGVS